MRSPLYRRLGWAVLTLGPVGERLPAAGTWASALTAAALWFAQPALPVALVPRLGLLWSVACVLAIVGTTLVQKLLRPGPHADHPAIVLDEVAGMLIAASPGALWGPGTVVHLLGALALFRLFDITKPLCIGIIDRRGTPGSVFADDLLAGAAAAAALSLLLVLVR